MSDSLDMLLHQFDPVGLERIEEYPSMKRTDTKFLFHRKMLAGILERASGQFSILEIDGNRIADYRNQYFDTEDRRFYFDHHNGRKHRTKVRLREYADSDIRFLEIKRKNNKGLTKKVRTQVRQANSELIDNPRIFVNEQLEEEFDLEPSLRNRFYRITLVHLENRERVTFDFDLLFETDSDQAGLDHLVVAEVKQYRSNNSSPIIDIFRSLGIQKNGFSKYCIGMATLDSGLKQNLFKQKIRTINKITA